MSAAFTLVSWNIFQGLHHTTRGRQWVQNVEIEQHLEDLDADVLVLPETWRFMRPNAVWAEDLAASMGYELHQWVADRPSRPSETVPWRMAVFTRIPALRLEDALLPTCGKLAQRAIVRVQLTNSGLVLGGAHLYGIHLLSKGLRPWLQERAAFRDIVSDLDIIAGDLNIWSPVVRRDTPGMQTAVSGRTFPANRPHSQIDHIRVRPTIQVLQAERLRDLGSDHRGLKVTLQATK